MAPTLTATQHHYRGVACSRCGQPIPIFTVVGNLNGQLHSFPLRCRVCEKEGIYTVADIHSFAGEPKQRRSTVVHMIRSRAANG